jgi:molybdopterin-guanine dinucleotide biosynthesis protein
MKKALSINDIMRKSYDTLPFTGEWLEAFDEPERTGVWFIWGSSGNGKSTFAMQLCTELCRHGKVLYNSLEEGSSLTFRKKIERLKDLIDAGRFNIVSEGMDELSQRLRKRRSADFVIIDSFQYAGINYEGYKKFKKENPDKLIIFISHADGKRPSGRAAKSVLFDASLKIWVEGFRATSLGRFIGGNGGTFTIWKQGEWRNWGKEKNSSNQ